MTASYDENEGILSYAIKDSGIGMTEKQLNNVFEAFSQADTSITRRFGGTGLGLMISSKLAKMLDGEITVESQEGEGSVFTLKIKIEGKPAKLQNTAEFNKQNPLDATQDIDFHKKMLLVEDNKTNQLLISKIFKKMGMTVEIANDGMEALDLLIGQNAHEYDIVFMDIQMPVMDGLTAIAKLRESSYDKTVVALTANAMDSDKSKCLEAGFSDFTTKPVNRKDLKRILLKYGLDQ